MAALQSDSPVIALRELAQGGLFDLLTRIGAAEQTLKQNQLAAKRVASFAGWAVCVQAVMQMEADKSARQLGVLLDMAGTVIMHEIEMTHGIPYRPTTE